MRTLKPIENGSLFYNTPINNAVFHVPGSGSSSVKAVRMSFDDDAITEVLLLEGENTEETSKTSVYDLNGMQKSGISKGLNIVNGKMILIKLQVISSPYFVLYALRIESSICDGWVALFAIL